MVDELDIVNHMLRSTGEHTVSTLASQHPSVIQARSSLESTNVDFQSTGWWFNKEYSVKLLPTAEGEIVVPDSALELIMSAATLNANTPAEKFRYVTRGSRIYDSIAHTRVIARTLYVDIVTQIEISDMPAVASTYLKHLAAHTFYVDDDGDKIKADELKERTRLAWARLAATQLRATASNALDSPAAQEMNYRIMQFRGRTNPNLIGG